MIFKEVGQTMDHVYQKSRHTRGPIRQIIAEMSEQEDSDQ